MKTLSLLLLLLVLLLATGQGFAKTCTATSSGNWRDTIYTGVGCTGAGNYPVSGDTLYANGGVVVTNPAGQSNAAAHVRLENSAGTASLVQNGTLTLDAGGSIRVGSATTAANEGSVTFGPGSVTTWTAGANGSLYINAGTVTSTATAVSRATVTGQFSVVNLLANPKQVFTPSYVDFTTTGSGAYADFTVAAANTNGSLTSQITVVGCTFNGWRNWYFGTAADTPAAANISLTNSDWRPGAASTLTVRRIAGDGGTYEFLGNTLQGFSAAAALNMTPTTAGGLEIGNNVFVDAYITEAAPGGLNVHDNFLAFATDSANLIRPSDAGTGITVDGNYFASTANNQHSIQSLGTGGKGTHTISNNILDGVVDETWTDPGDMWIPGATPLANTCTGNLALNASLWNGSGVTRPATVTVTISNNTNVSIIASAVGAGSQIYGVEGTAIGGTHTISSNLQRGNGHAAEVMVGGSASGANQVVASSDYNDSFNVANPYSATRLTVTAGQTHDLTVDPAFVDPTRNLGKWNANSGSGTDSYADAIAYLLGINGYRAANKDQGGTVSANGPDKLVEWVRYGFSPTNGALRKAGDPAGGSLTIGAVEWQNPRRKATR